MAVYFVCGVFPLVYSAARHGAWNALFQGCLIGSGAIAALVMRRWHRQQDELLHTSLTGRVPLHTQDLSDASPEVRSYLEERALIIASLLARGASEIYLQHHQVLEGAQVITRQVHNSLLRRAGLWDRLDRHESDLASTADGLWSVEQQGAVVEWSEHQRVLRWVFGIDVDLMPLAHLPKLDFSLAQAILRRGRPLSGKPLLKSWDIRIERDIASSYTARLIAEFKGRGLVNGAGEELDGWADELRAKSLGDSADYLAGTQTVRDLDDDALRRFGALAWARERYCGYLVDLLNEAQPFSYASWGNGTVNAP